MRGTGFLGQHADEVYHLEEDDLYLVGTSEVPLAGYHMDEILDLSKGAKRYAGWSTCYRREAGSHGKDTRGIIRVHQFNKLEMFVYTTPEDAEAEHLRLVALQEAMLQDLGLALPRHRRRRRRPGLERGAQVRRRGVGADAGRVPRAHQHEQLHDLSVAPARHPPPPAGEGGTERQDQHVATLNGTLATTRWIVAILETHQRADGSVVVPEVLRPYLGGLEVLEPVA